MFKDVDKTIEERLEEMSNFHPNEKDEIWNAIENEIFSEKRSRTKKKPRKRKWGIFVAAAAVMLLAFGTQTETGSALVDKVKSMFEPEKDVKQSIEGTEEETNLQLNEGKESEYIIYVDEERYVMNKTEAGDIITTKEPLGEQYPEVSMTITQVKEQDPATVYTDLKTKTLSDYPITILEEDVTEPAAGKMLFAKKDGTEWNNELIKVYVIDNKAEGSYIIQQKYFAEAEEGHGARFDHMLKEFQIISE